MLTKDSEPSTTFLCGTVDSKEALSYVTTLHSFYLIIGLILVLSSIYGNVICISFTLILSAFFIGISGALCIIGARHAQKYPLALVPLRIWQISILILLFYCFIAALYEFVIIVSQYFDDIISNSIIGWSVICFTLAVFTFIHCCTVVVTHQYHRYVLERISTRNALEESLGVSACRSFQRVIYVRRKEDKQQDEQQQQQQHILHTTSGQHRSPATLISEPIEV